MSFRQLDGAPEEIRTPDPQIRSLRVAHVPEFAWCSQLGAAAAGCESIGSASTTLSIDRARPICTLQHAGIGDRIR
jgi:hypothetical protein